jgi:hypothetical protein
MGWHVGVVQDEHIERFPDFLRDVYCWADVEVAAECPWEWDK